MFLNFFFEKINVAIKQMMCGFDLFVSSSPPQKNQCCSSKKGFAGNRICGKKDLPATPMRIAKLTLYYTIN